MKIDIVFIISGLDVGGAQMMLYKLLLKIDRELFRPKVISLVATPAMIEKFVDIGVPVTNLALRSNLSVVSGVVKLVKILREDKPHIVQTWMYHADLLGGISAKIAGIRNVVWNIRHSNLEAKVDKKTTIITARVCALISSYLPKYIVCCSEVAKEIHVKLGYDSARTIVIPNGFDLELFSPNKDAHHELRNELGISVDKVLIGLIGRYHPHKDHKNFIAAAEILFKKVNGVEFLMCGQDVDWQNEELTNLIDSAGLRGAFHLLGLRNDISKVTVALDIATSASSGEGFSNTIGEAMACGVPCVVTDVGDSAMIVDSTGKVVPSRNPAELSQAWLELVHSGEEERHELGREARKRIVENFSIDNIVDRYQNLYLRTMPQPGHFVAG